MAINRRFADDEITRALPVPATWVSGRPVCSGQIPGVCLTDRDANGIATVQVDGTFKLKVQGVDASGVSGADANSAVAVGDILYYDETPLTAGYYLSKRAGGIRFGYVDGIIPGTVVVAGGALGTIAVKVGY